MGGLLGAGGSEVARAIFIVAGGAGIDLSIGATLAPAAIVDANMAPIWRLTAPSGSSPVPF
jgi:hypothetical protein